jgi:hypothetical protein
MTFMIFEVGVAIITLMILMAIMALLIEPIIELAMWSASNLFWHGSHDHFGELKRWHFVVVLMLMPGVLICELVTCCVNCIVVACVFVFRLPRFCFLFAARVPSLIIRFPSNFTRWMKEDV